MSSLLLDSNDSFNLSFNMDKFGIGLSKYNNINQLALWTDYKINDLKFKFNTIIKDKDNKKYYDTSIIFKYNDNINIGGLISLTDFNINELSMGCDLINILEFENIQFPIIKKINIKKIIQYGESIDILIETENANSLLYFLIDSKGKIQASEKLNVIEDNVTIKMTSEITKKLQTGANSIKIFVISDSVLKPDFYQSSFLVSENNVELPSTIINTPNIENKINYGVWIIPIILVMMIIGIIAYVKTKYQNNP